MARTRAIQAVELVVRRQCAPRPQQSRRFDRRCRTFMTTPRAPSAATTAHSPLEAEDDGVVQDSSLTAPLVPSDSENPFDPIEYERRRRQSTRKFFPPMYYRGPLHPVQPAPAHDPSSREFVPGPFSLPRLEETYHSTLAPDLLTLLYHHYPPGALPEPQAGSRLRSWDGSSPYHKNRPLRAPRGPSKTLPLARKPITFRNIPTLEKIHVSAFVSSAGENPHAMHIAGMALQAITNVRATRYSARSGMVEHGIKAGRPCAVGAQLTGEAMWDFLAKCVDIVMPRIKEFPGVSGKSGDSSGNIAWKFTSDALEGFPEIEVNYDAYPAKMLPAVDVVCCTTARTDKDARLLLSALGVPFHGKHRN